MSERTSTGAAESSEVCYDTLEQWARGKIQAQLQQVLEEEVTAARRNNYSFAVIMMDLDGFKAVNDTYGHSVGDDVLRLVFSKMERGVRNTDFMAR